MMTDLILFIGVLEEVIRRACLVLESLQADNQITRLFTESIATRDDRYKVETNSEDWFASGSL